MIEQAIIGEIKISQQFFVVEYRLFGKPFTSQVNVPIEMFSDEKVKLAIEADLRSKVEALRMIDEITKKWSGRTLDVERPQ